MKTGGFIGGLLSKNAKKRKKGRGGGGARGGGGVGLGSAGKALERKKM